MIAAFRNKLRTGIMLGILGVGLIAIVITGFGTGGMGGIQGGASASPTQTLVEIGGEKLTEAELTSRIDNIFRQNARQNPNLDRPQFIEEAFAPLLESVIQDRSLVAFARSLGFVVPQLMVDRAIVAIPAFQNVAGQFDDASFRQALSQANLTERQLREDIEFSQLIRMVADPVSGGSRLPQAVANEYANLLLERRSGQIGAVPTELLARGLQPSDQEIAQFYQRNQRSFALPERRVIRFALVGREQLGDAVRATDQDIAAYYQQNQAQYGPGEKRDIQSVVLPDEAAARAFVQKVQGGTSFADAAAQTGFAAGDINLPQQTREQFTNAANADVANAAFSAQSGALAGPFRTQFGFQVVRVDAITRTPARPIESVRGEIVTAVEQRKLAEQLNAAVERIQERLDDGASFEEVAQAEHLNVQTTPPVAANGAGVNFQMPSDLAPLLQTGFDMAPEDDAQLAVVQPDVRSAVVAVANVLPSAPPPLAEIKDQVRARLVQQTAAQRARTVADAIVSRINGGMAPAQAYAQAGIPLPAPRTVTLQRLQISRAGEQVPPPLTMLFSIPQGRARVVAAPNNGGWIIVHHQQRTSGNIRNDPNGSQLLEVTQRGLSGSGATELRQQFARAVQAALGINRNDAAIDALRQRLRTGQ
jgi:peptidyl-prolyl cis-trans isomerase D